MTGPTTPNTSAIEEQMRHDLKDAARARDQVRMDTIRMALTAFTNEAVSRSRQALSEQDRAAILDKQVKQRAESAQIYRVNDRPELAEKEEREIAILRTYMPAALTDDEIRGIVQGLIAQHGKEFKKVMPLASKETRGRADGKRVSEIVRELTA